MTLTDAQNATLKAFIEADATLNAFPNNDDGAQSIANEINKEASPTYTVWKTSVTLDEVMNAIDGDELDGLTTANTNRLQVFASYTTEGVTTLPNQADKRALFDGVFSGAGGNITRPNLLTLYKKLANIIEQLFSITPGTGTDADPATLDFEGNISRQEVFTARNS